MVYGNGKEIDCNYYFYGLDWNTGNIVIRKLLGNSENYNDPGCNISISDDSTLVEPTATGFIQIKYGQNLATNNYDSNEKTSDINIYPNPSNGVVNFKINSLFSKFKLSIFNLTGQNIIDKIIENKEGKIDLLQLNEGVYYLKLESLEENNVIINKKLVFVK